MTNLTINVQDAISAATKPDVVVTTVPIISIGGKVVMVFYFIGCMYALWYYRKHPDKAIKTLESGKKVDMVKMARHALFIGFGILLVFVGLTYAGL